MLEQRARFARLRDRSVFVGDPDDIVDADLRSRACRRSATGPSGTSTSPGYVTGFDPAELPTARRCASASAIAPGRDCSASSRSAARASALPCCTGFSTRSRWRGALVPDLHFVVVTGPADRSGLPARAAGRRRCAATCRTCTGTSPRRDLAIVAGRSHHLHGADRAAQCRSSTSRCGTTSSRTSTSAPAWTATSRPPPLLRGGLRPGRRWPPTSPNNSPLPRLPRPVATDGAARAAAFLAPPAWLVLFDKHFTVW